MPSFYQIFETGVSAQSHKQHSHHNSAISSYTLVEQKVSKQQLISFSTLVIYTVFQKKFTLLVFTITKSDVDQF